MRISQPLLALFFSLSRFSIFVLVELAWGNANNHTGGSNHGTQGQVSEGRKPGVGTTPGSSSSGPPRQSSLAYAHRATHYRSCSLFQCRWCPGRLFPPRTLPFFWSFRCVVSQLLCCFCCSAAAASEAPAASFVSASGSRRVCKAKQQELIGAKECRGE